MISSANWFIYQMSNYLHWCSDWVGLINQHVFPGKVTWHKAAFNAKLILCLKNPSMFKASPFWLQSNSTDSCLYLKGVRVVLILFLIPLVSVTLYLHPPSLLKFVPYGCIWLVIQHGPAPVIQVPRVFPYPEVYCSHLALWFASLISGTGGAVDVCGLQNLAMASPVPPCCCDHWNGSAGTPGPVAELFSSNQDVVYQSLETAPSVAWWQCAISYCILKTDCLLCV